MTERDVDATLLALKGAVEAEDEKLSVDCALVLAGGALKNLARIADALEQIAMLTRPC